MKYCLVVVFLFGSIQVVLGQGIDTLKLRKLEPATVIAVEDYTTSDHLLSLYTLGLSELMLTEYGINVRRNSASGLSTLNYQGFSPGQTRITWNGMPINNPMNGQADLSLMPFFLIDGISLGMSTEKTSGFNSTVGGELSLTSNVSHLRSDHASLMGAIGRFDNYTAGADAQYKIAKSVFGRSRAYFNSAQNNYPYHDVLGDSRSLTNAKSVLYAVMQDFESQKIKASLWAQMADRNIPPTILESRSLKNQIDKHLRGVVEYKPFSSNPGILFKYGFALESIDYTDPIANINSDNRSFNQFLTVQRSSNVGRRSSIVSGIDVQNAFARTSSYGKVKPQVISTLRGSWSYRKRRGETVAGLRLTTRGTEMPSLLPSMKYVINRVRRDDEGTTKGWERHSFIYERGLRFPTLNDLFWTPGGDTELRPEISDKAGVITEFVSKRIKTKFELFGALVNSQIQWLPAQSGIFEATQNPGAYSANYGANFSIGTLPVFRQSPGAMNVEWQFRYNYTRSMSDVRDPDWQRIYVPEHQAVARFGLNIKGLYTGLVLTGMSRRYLTTTNDDWLTPAYYADLVLTYKWKDFSATVRGNNILGTEYYLLAYRPMPMHDYKILLTYKIHSKNDK